MIKVSVIVPVYNGEKSIAKCLDSILEQTLSDIEIIIVNDCSTDRTKDIIEEYQYKHKEIIKATVICAMLRVMNI